MNSVMISLIKVIVFEGVWKVFEVFIRVLEEIKGWRIKIVVLKVMEGFVKFGVEDYVVNELGIVIFVVEYVMYDIKVEVSIVLL